MDLPTQEMHSTVEEDENTTSFSYVKRISTDNRDWSVTKEQHPQLTLYFHMDCPFCLRVLNYLDRLNKAVFLKNVKETPETRDELLEIGGKTQVPCLTIDGKALYESLDIIRWISENKEQIPDLDS